MHFVSKSKIIESFTSISDLVNKIISRYLLFCINTHLADTTVKGKDIIVLFDLIPNLASSSLYSGSVVKKVALIHPFLFINAHGHTHLILPSQIQNNCVTFEFHLIQNME